MDLMDEGESAPIVTALAIGELGDSGDWKWLDDDEADLDAYG